MKKLSLLLIWIILLTNTADGHVGSPGVTFEGNAGPYKILATITPPDVIPGVATVSVYVENNAKGVKIRATPIYWFSGSDGSPGSDEASPSTTNPGGYEIKLWMMTAGASSIKIFVDGPQGNGSVVVPVMAVATAQRDMPVALGWLLLGMTVFLVVLMVTIIGSSVSDSLLDPGLKLSKKWRRKRLRGSMGGLVVLVLVLYGGWLWWNAAAADYRKFLYTPLQATTTLSNDGKLSFVIDTGLLNVKDEINRMDLNRKMNYLVPDHGKLMHLFLVRAGELNAFAHLHPQRIDSVTFISQMPDLPAGKYFVYADITRLSGFAETIVDTLNVPQSSIRLASNREVTTKPFNKDDTYFVTNPIHGGDLPASARPSIMCGSAGLEAKLQDGSSAVWLQGVGQKIRAGELTLLRFEILDKNRRPALLEPYLGMAAHAVILKDDGSVYIHLHPAGSFSMGSQKALLDRIAFHRPLNEYLPKPAVFADSINHFVARLDAMEEKERNKILMAGMGHPVKKKGAAHHLQEISFPYTFPEPGNYRIFIQTKRSGQLLNTAFDAKVE